MLRMVVILVGVGLTLVESLPHFDNYKEGSCSSLPAFKTVKTDPQFMNKLRYIVAGSRYFMYRLASANHQYNSIRESDFYYDICMQRNTTTSYPAIASIYGFGQVLASFNVRPGSKVPSLEKEGVYLEGTARTNSPNPEVVQLKVALTDQKTFALIVNCWKLSDQKGWNVVSLVPSLSREVQDVIENFVSNSLGFKKEESMFLRYDNCKDMNPTETNQRTGRARNQKPSLAPHSNRDVFLELLSKDRIPSSAVQKRSGKAKASRLLKVKYTIVD